MQATIWLEETRERRKVASIRFVQTVLVMATQLAMVYGLRRYDKLSKRGIVRVVLSVAKSDLDSAW